MMKNARAGFTLAEVLTTLMVIGVVAAMTIPTLINSTSDAQYKAAYKKALSVLGQGAQLIIAKEQECTVTSSATLAECMNNVIAGTRATVSTSTVTPGAGNAIITSDGMIYAFYYRGDTSANYNRSLTSICGQDSDDTKWDGSASNCIVVVDLNGTAKGTKGFTAPLSSKSAVASGVAGGGDQQVLRLTGEGVKPVYLTSATSSANINLGYTYLYGTSSIPSN